MAETVNDPDALVLTAQIVSAHVSNNVVAPDQLPDLIRNVFAALGKVTSPEQPKSEPAVSIRQSVHADHVVCLEDGKKFSMLKRHLMTDHKMTPEQYRQKWGLPSTYPMVAPNYAKTRSNLAKQFGLGRIDKGAKKAAPKKVSAARIQAVGRPRGRPKKIA